MLVDFCVKNFKSFDDKQIFSLLKDKGDENLDNTFIVGKKQKLQLLKCAAIYGANASGKSNLIDALQTMKSIVLFSLKHVNSINLFPFKLAKRNLSEPTEFEVTIVVNDVRYQYGFSATAAKIIEEWLFAFPNGHVQKWFERSWDQKDSDYEWSFSPSFPGTKQSWVKQTRSDALFLTTAVQLNSERLKPIYDWFKNELFFCDDSDFYPEFTAELCDKGKKDIILKFLKAADLNISDISIEEIDNSTDAFPDGFPEELKNFFIKNMPKKKKKIKTLHRDNNGDLVSFNFFEESTGTRKLFGFAGPIIDVLEKGYTLFIDELDVNLHPKLVEFIVKLFNSKENNPNNAQLVFTSHDVYVLDQNNFRRDQIWFCEKNDNQATEVYSLLEFSPNKKKDNLILRYLSGRYGALPIISSFNMFKGDK